MTMSHVERISLEPERSGIQDVQLPSKELEKMHVGHASARVRIPRSLRLHELNKFPQLPDELKGLQVTENSRNLNKTIIPRFKDLATDLAKIGFTAKAIVSEVQWQEGEMLSATEIVSVHGWAREIIAKQNGDPNPFLVAIKQDQPPNRRPVIPEGTPLVEITPDGPRIVSYQERMARAAMTNDGNEEK